MMKGKVTVMNKEITLSKEAAAVANSLPTITDVPLIDDKLFTDMVNPFEAETFTMFEESALLEGDIDWLLGRKKFQAPTVELIKSIRALYAEKERFDVDEFLHHYFLELCVEFRESLTYGVALEMSGVWMLYDDAIFTWALSKSDDKLLILEKLFSSEPKIEEISSEAFYELVTDPDKRVVRMMVDKFGKRNMLERAEQLEAGYESDWCYSDRVPAMRRVITRLKRFK